MAETFNPSLDGHVISLIVARSANNVIGVNNKLPWHLPEDLAFFKRTTKGHPVIMGRKTYASIGHALPGRTNIVMTRDVSFGASDVKIAHSLESALSLAAASKGSEEICIIGGAAIYKEALDKNIIERMYITEVDTEISGDTYFPDFNTRLYPEIEASKVIDENGYFYRWTTRQRNR